MGAELSAEELESLKRGLEQSANGEVVSRGSFAQYADEDED